MLSRSLSLRGSHAKPTAAVRAVPERHSTPHSGYHYTGSSRSFFEGWYWKVDTQEGSFALMYSIEHPDSRDTSGVGIQVMGPDDGYICQYSKKLSSFWGSRNELALGACLKAADSQHQGTVPQHMLTQERFNDSIAQGFQASDAWHQGAIVSDDANCDGSIPNAVSTASWAFSMRPLYGWGDSGAPQRATAGWLSTVPVFEPHWQVLMSHGLATGSLQWGDRTIDFKDCPAYAEKNWGGAFPEKWFWLQCNSFEGHPNLSVTGVGAKRGLGENTGIYEDVGMVGIHFQGHFLELVPWKGQVEWQVDPWGCWKLWAQSPNHEVLLEASTTSFGTLLRAPTKEDGLSPFCRDTFDAECRLRVWKLKGNGDRKSETPIIDATSKRAAAEVGGGPWWSAWKAEAKMSAPVSAALNVPVDIARMASAVKGTIGDMGLPAGL